jgi:acyl-CoA synthetase (AMP-forming)/AMP-acid ligase II
VLEWKGNWLLGRPWLRLYQPGKPSDITSGYPDALAVWHGGAGAGDAAELAAYKYPRHVEVLADLPKTPTGKLLRRELR